MTPPKKNRDSLTRQTPPEGVRAQTSPPVGEKWTGDTGVDSLAYDPDDDTPINPHKLLNPVEIAKLDAEAVVRQRERVKETNSAVQDVKRITETTSAGIDTLRMETRAVTDELKGNLKQLDGKVDTMSGHVLSVVGAVGDLKGVVGELRGTVGELVKNGDAKRERQQITFEAHVDIDKEAKIVEIHDQGDAQKKRRDFLWSIAKKAARAAIGVAAAAGVVVATLVAERC